MRIALFADLHLDAPFGWARLEVARRRRQALRDCLRKIVEVAEEERVEAILCAGDLYEHDYVSPDSREFLRSTLGSTGIRVLVAPGNHDWFGPASIYRQMVWSGNVHVFSEPRLERYELTPGLLVWGSAFTSPTRTESFLGEHRLPGGAIHIALFHGAETSGAPVEGKALHAPFRAPDVERSGFAHAFVGHYHQPADHELYTYPGNPDPLTFGETGDRGVVIADISPDGSIQRRRRSVAVSSVHDVEVDVSSCDHFQEVREAVAARLAGLAGAVRLSLRGELAPEIALDVDGFAQVAEGIEQLVVRTDELEPGYDFDVLAAEPTVRGRFVAKVRADRSLDDPTKRRVLVTGLRALAGRDDLEAF